MANEEEICRQSGVIPYRYIDSELRILMVTSKNNGRWTIPKGLVEDYLTPADSAAKEAYEEAGIEGLVKETSVGSFRYRKLNRLFDVEVFLMEVSNVLDDWPESSERRREWMSMHDAAERVVFPELHSLLKNQAKTWRL